MMKLLLLISAASAWSLGVPKGLPKLNNRALQQTAQRQNVVAATPASSTALKATEVTGGAKSEDGLMETLKTGSFFALWYLFNIGYNIYNKKALNAMAIPWTMALLQLFVGIPYVAALVDGLNVPGAHGVGSLAPTEQNVPSGQAMHCSTPVITSSDVF